eukprot:c25707_g1_i2 orf=379-1479(+)
MGRPLPADLASSHLIYAPLTINGSKIDERTLYVFGCPSSNCGISPLSWCTLRVQRETGSSLEPSQAASRNIGSVSEASSSSAAGELIGEDLRVVEGINNRDGQQNGGGGSDWWEDDSWGPIQDGEDDVLLGMEDLETALLEAGYASATWLGTQNSDVEDEAVTFQEDASTGRGERVDPGLPVLPCFYIYSQSESHPSRGSRAVSALQTIELLEGRGDWEDGNRDRGDESWEGEEYEHDRALSADRSYLKFKKRLDCYPEQCFRYCFGGQPLWANKDRGEPGICTMCGGPRVYEMQLMPPLLYYLQQACKDLPPTSNSPNDWEWLTLIVYTCARSCTQGPSDHAADANGQRKQWTVIEEATILQYEM